MSRRQLLTGVSSLMVAFPGVLPQGQAIARPPISQKERFPYFRSAPVSFTAVRLTDGFWAPRQNATYVSSVSWISRALDAAGGIDVLRKDPTRYATKLPLGQMESVKFIEALATVARRTSDKAITSLATCWTNRLVAAQGSDGYLQSGHPVSLAKPETRWLPVHWSHEDYLLGHYIDAAIAWRHARGNDQMFPSALRAADNMVEALGSGRRPYASGHPEIEQAMLRLYGETGDVRYRDFAKWLLDQRGKHAGRPSYGKMRLDDVPVVEQSGIQGHAVMAAYVHNAGAMLAAATGDEAYRQASLRAWDDLVDHHLYLHGASGNESSKIEGYRSEDNCIRPDDVYGESCSVYANFLWAHTLFRLTGESRFLDVAERIAYNAFYASLSLAGDSSFYENVAQTDKPYPRLATRATSCCPPNIIKLFNTIGGYLYETDPHGVIVKHYAQSDASIEYGSGVFIEQRTNYPWNGNIALTVQVRLPTKMRLRLRVPSWAQGARASLNGAPLQVKPQAGWLDITRLWSRSDKVELAFEMEVQRVTLPARFAEYRNRAALQRGPIVYCLEAQDVEPLTPEGNAATGPYAGLATLYIPESAIFVPESRPDLLGGITVLTGELRQLTSFADESERPVKAMLIPYGVWGNRQPGAMRIWLGARRVPLVELLLPQQELGESCMG